MAISVPPLRTDFTRALPALPMRAVMTPVEMSMCCFFSDTVTGKAGAAGSPAARVKVSALAAGPTAWAVHFSDPSGQ